jgi:hypothetical protein
MQADQIKEIRMDCLKYAAMFHGHINTPKEYLDLAEKFYKWATEIKQSEK